MNKGQIFLTDLVASIAVFSIFVMAFGVMWNTSIEKFNDKSTIYDRGERTFNLLTSEGHPHNWNTSNVEMPGIYTNGKLNKSKFLRVNNLSSTRRRQILRAQQYLIKAEYLNGTILEEDNQELKINSSTTIPSDKSVYTYRKLTLTASDKKRTKITYLMWDG